MAVKVITSQGLYFVRLTCEDDGAHSMMVECITYAKALEVAKVLLITHIYYA